MNLHDTRSIAKSLSIKCDRCGKVIKSWTSDDMQNSYLTFVCGCSTDWDGWKHKIRIRYWPSSSFIEKLKINKKKGIWLESIQ